jgi:ATP-binding cassette subfamily B multidrug efflux pump
MTTVDDQRDSDGPDEAATPDPVAPPAGTGPRPVGRFGSVGVPVERSKDVRSVIKRLARLLSTERPKLIVVLVASIAGVVLNVIGPRLLGHGTDVIIQGAQLGHLDFGKLHHILDQAIAVYVGSMLFTLLTANMIAGIVQRLMLRLRSDVENKIHRLPLSYIDQGSRGDLLSRVTNDIDNIAQSMQQTLSQLLNAFFMIIAVFVAMLFISPLLALVALTIVPVSFVVMRTIAAKARPRYIAQWRTTGALNTIVEETFTGHAIVKAFGRQGEVEERFRETNEELFQASAGAQFLSSLMQPLTMFLSNLQYVLVAVIGGWRVTTGAITVGEIQAFLQYSRSFAMPLTQIGSMLNIFQSGLASLERVFEFLDAGDESPDPAPQPAMGERRGRVAFESVRFAYRPDMPLIDDLDLVAEPGQTVAIVGPTGAGKTTLVNLLMRFYDVQDGRIVVDGRDITSIPRAELRADMGMVLQDTWLFGGSIRENIRYGRPDATDDEVHAAAEATYVDRFVHSLPDGYDTLINEEADNVSAGQKQLLTIARAFLADRPILILDEATSSVDTRTEVQIQVAMNRLRSSRTSFVIAHRLSTIRGADTILVMENGSIVEQGSHQELLTQDGAYATLFRAQFDAPIADTSNA